MQVLSVRGEGNPVLQSSERYRQVSKHSNTLQRREAHGQRIAD